MVVAGGRWWIHGQPETLIAAGSSAFFGGFALTVFPFTFLFLFFTMGASLPFFAAASSCNCHALLVLRLVALCFRICWHLLGLWPPFLFFTMLTAAEAAAKKGKEAP